MRLPLASLIVLYSTRKWRYFLWVRSISVNSEDVLLCVTMNRLKTKYWHSQIQRPYWFSIQNMNTIIPRRIAQGLISWFLMQNMNTHPQKDSCKVWSYTVGRSDDMAWPNKSPSTQESHLPTLPDIVELFQIFGKGIENVSKKHRNLFTSVSKGSKPWPLARFC